MPGAMLVSTGTSTCAASAADAIDACASTTTSAAAACALDAAATTSASCVARSPAGDSGEGTVDHLGDDVGAAADQARRARAAGATVGVRVVGSVASTAIRPPAATAASAIASSMRSTGIPTRAAVGAARCEIDEHVSISTSAPAVLAAWARSIDALGDGCRALGVAEVGDDPVIEVVDEGRVRERGAGLLGDGADDDGPGVQERDASHALSSRDGEREHALVAAVSDLFGFASVEVDDARGADRHVHVTSRSSPSKRHEIDASP